MGSKSQILGLPSNHRLKLMCRTLLVDAGLNVRAEYDDEGGNHYYEAVKP